MLNIFREHRVSIEQITTGIDSICLVVAEKEFKGKTIYPGVSEQIIREIEPDEFMRWLKTHLNADNVQIRRKVFPTWIPMGFHVRPLVVEIEGDAGQGFIIFRYLVHEAMFRSDT